jgi:uncharacterized protein (UPF0276 family)
MTRREPPLVGVSLMLEDDFARAAYPLFEVGEIEILEWSFDVGWPPATVPQWAEDLLAFYSANGRLLGHGVSYSALSAGIDEQQATWLRLLERELASRSYRHISEHFGFSSSRNFHQSAPLPVPLSDTTLTLGRERLVRLRDVAGVPIGLENLAFAFSIRDVEEQGRFLDQLLAPIDGFMLLDLHNLYCQANNFQRSLDELIAGYPLARVRELHISGGSWRDGIRRDTHDGDVPAELIAWLPRVLERCPHVEAVIFERMGGTIRPADEEAFRRDFRRLKEAVHAAT